MSFSFLIKNRVVFYLASRYVTYAIQFITSLMIAAELGPYYMGIWGFILLILQYFQQLHLGIANSFNVLYVHHRDSQQECDNYIGNSLFLICYLSIIVLLFYLYCLFVGIHAFEKYHSEQYIIWICLIAILQYYVQFFVNLFRVKNLLNHVTFCQSIIVFLNFICIFFFRGEQLIKCLVAGYMVGNILCVFLALISGVIPSFNRLQFCIKIQREILHKGLYLFFYNSCFYFIIISIRTIISHSYLVEEFGYFTFSFTLAHAILLIIEALSFIIFPKVIGKLSSHDVTIVNSMIKFLRSVYITASHFLIYIALLLFPYLLLLFPKYNGVLTCFNLIALTILIGLNSYGYTELLISKNKEKFLAFSSFIALLINCSIASFFVMYMHCSYTYLIIATMITYIVFTLIIYFKAKILLKEKPSFTEWFPFRLLFPYVVAFLVTVTKQDKLLFAPLLVLLLFNWKQFKEIKNSVVLILYSPNKVNL